MNKFQAIYRFSDTFQAEALLNMLKGKGISATKRLFEDSAYDGIYKPQYGLGEILVSEQDYRDAKTIVKNFEAVNEKNTEDDEFKKLRANIHKNSKRHNLICAAIVIPIFFVLGVYVLLYSPYRIISGVFFLATFLFFIYFYILHRIYNKKAT